MELNVSKSRTLRRWINVLSIVIPLVVALLFGMKKVEGFDTSFLPPIYATINGITAILLVIAFILVKQRKLKAHENIIKICMGLSVTFLLLYVVYHLTSDATPYGGSMGWLYYPLLIAHVLLSVVVIPLVLYSFLFASEGNYARHRKWTRFSFPIWLFVAASGVVVYLMIAPYYK